MNNILENFYLYGNEFIKNHLAVNPEYGSAKNAFEEAEKALTSTLDDSQRRLYLHLVDANDALRNQASAGAFAGGYRFRAMLSSAMFD